jgi:hypothetical protein
MGANVEERFKVMEGSFSPVIGNPIVILTGRDNASEDCLQGEWFYVIDFNGLEVVKGTHVKANRRLSVGRDIDVFWEKELVETVQKALFYDEVYPKIKDRRESYLENWEPRLRDVDSTMLFHVKKRSIFFVDSIFRWTENDALRRFLLSLDDFELEYSPYIEK